MSGDRAIPDGVWSDIAALLDKRKDATEAIHSEIVLVLAE
jgi:hypothetical protein